MYLSSGRDGLRRADIEGARTCRGRLSILSRGQQEVVVGDEDGAVGQALELALPQQELGAGVKSWRAL